MANRFYTYWEGVNSPKYLHLCVASWFKHIPDLELTVINHSNLHDWVGDTYNIENLKNYSLPIQSDAVSAAVLARHGGIFIDCDTILTKYPTEFMSLDPGNTMRCFGMPSTRRFHVAVLGVGSPMNALAMRWMTEAAARVASPVVGAGWDHLGGQILDPLLDSGSHLSYIDIIDRRTSGNILEATYDLATGQGKASYEKLYFDSEDVELNDALETVRDGIISLHNSWTPESYSSLSSHESVLAQGGLLSKILGEVSDLNLARLVEEKYL